MMQFEEGIFTDLRNLKPGVDASLEETKASFCFFVFCCLADFFVFVRAVARASSISSPARTSKPL